MRNTLIQYGMEVHRYDDLVSLQFRGFVTYLPREIAEGLRDVLAEILEDMDNQPDFSQSTMGWRVIGEESWLLTQDSDAWIRDQEGDA